jgi:hypothetical protein
MYRIARSGVVLWGVVAAGINGVGVPGRGQLSRRLAGGSATMTKASGG